MSEIQRYAETLKDPLEKISEYFHVLEGDSPEDYENALGLLDGVLYEKTEDFSVTDIHTHLALDSLRRNEEDPNARKDFLSRAWRTSAAQQVINGMILGEIVPEEQFGDILIMAVSAINKINLRDQNDKHFGRYKALKGMLDLWRNYPEPNIRNRTSSAINLIGNPARYGKLLAKEARP